MLQTTSANGMIEGVQKQETRPKDPAAVSLGRRGGAKRVPKGFSVMDPARRSEIARAAAAKRWSKAA